MYPEDSIVTPATKVWWIKLLSAIAVSGVTFYINVYMNIDGVIAFLAGVVLYIGISNILARMNNFDTGRGLKIGWGIFLITWLVVWTLINTMFNYTPV